MNDITKRSVTEHALALRRGEYSARELTTEYLKVIKERDENIGAFLFVDEKGALADADRADEMLRAGEASPLCGIPYAAKDNIVTKGIPTTCASKILENYIPPYDATVITKLKGCGAVLLGKTNMDEFGMGSSTENSAFGLTRNPLDLTRSPGGSSGGSAAAVAAGMAAFALGSDTGGSVRQPAAFCGIFGMKPTYGAVSRYGLCALSPSLDQIGPLTSSARDGARVLSAICGGDRMDSTSVFRDWGDLTHVCGTDFSKMKIGVVRETLDGVSAEVQRAMNCALKTLDNMGCGIVEVSIPSYKYVFPAYKVICSAEASSNMGRYDGIRYGVARGGEQFFGTRELLGAEVKRRIMLGTFVLATENYEKYYLRAQKVKQLAARETDEALSFCDVIVSPAASTTAFPIGKAELSDGLYAGDVSCMAANLAGLPSLSVPCSAADCPLPAGMMLTGKKFSESTLFGLADVFTEAYHE